MYFLQLKINIYISNRCWWIKTRQFLTDLYCLGIFEFSFMLETPKLCVYKSAAKKSTNSDLYFKARQNKFKTTLHWSSGLNKSFYTDPVHRTWILTSGKQCNIMVSIYNNIDQLCMITDIVSGHFRTLIHPISRSYWYSSCRSYNSTLKREIQHFHRLTPPRKSCHLLKSINHLNFAKVKKWLGTFCKVLVDMLEEACMYDAGYE